MRDKIFTIYKLVIKWLSILSMPIMLLSFIFSVFNLMALSFGFAAAAIISFIFLGVFSAAYEISEMSQAYRDSKEHKKNINE